MANTRISQLPEYTGNTYNGYIIWNDSGETTTYKTRYNGIFGEKIEIKDTSQTSNTINPINRNSLIVGYGNNISASISGKNYFILGNDNTINSVVGGNPTNIVIGGNNTASSFGGWVVGSYSSVSGERALKWGNNGTASGTESFAWGEQSNASGVRSFVFGAYQSGSGDNSFTFGNNNTNSGTLTFNYGTLNTTSSSYSVAIGGYGNVITGSGNAQGIFVGNECDITASGPFNSIINGDTHLISGTSTRSTIVGGKTNTINSLDDVAMIGCSGRTSTTSATTYVENLHIYRTPSTQVQPVVSGTTFTCDLELGAKSQFYITGTSTINITNVRDGASFMIKTQTDGNYVMTWTATGGYTFLFEGGIKDPGNNVIDIFKFEVFGNVIYGSRAHNFA